MTTRDGVASLWWGLVINLEDDLCLAETVGVVDGVILFNLGLLLGSLLSGAFFLAGFFAVTPSSSAGKMLGGQSNI